MTQAKRDYQRAGRHAADPVLRRRQRRAADHDLDAALHALEAASASWEILGQPHARRIETLIATANRAVRHSLDATRAQQAQGPWASLHHSGPHQMPRNPGKNDDIRVG